MNRKLAHTALRVTLCLTLLLAPPFPSQKALAQIPVTDLLASGQRIKSSITEAFNFGLEIEKMAEQLLAATGQLKQAQALAEQMATVYKKVGDVVAKGREIYRLYRTIDDTRQNIAAIAQEYQYYANGGVLSASSVRRMNYIIRQITDDVTEIMDYVSKTILKPDSGLSAAEKNATLDKLTKDLKGKNNTARRFLNQDLQDRAAFDISSVEQAMISEMMGAEIRSIDDTPSRPGGRGSVIGGAFSSGSILPAIDWSSTDSASDSSEDSSPTDHLPKDRLFRVIYIIEGLITILMAPIAYYRVNKGEANAQDALLKVVFGFFFAVVLTTILKAWLFA